MKGVLGKMRKKDRKHERLSTLTKISKLHGKRRLQYPKFWTWRSAFKVTLDCWMVAHIIFGLRNDATS